MEKTIESMVNKEQVEFNLTDFLVPGKALRHLPKILKYDFEGEKGFDLLAFRVMQGSDVIIAGAITTGQYLAYSSLVSYFF